MNSVLALDILGGIGKALWDAVLPSMATVIAGMVMLVLKRIAAKHGIELTEKQETRLKQITVEAIHAVEEQAHREPMSGEDKHDLAVRTVVAVATADTSIPDPSTVQASAKVDAALGEARSAFLPNPGLPGQGRR